MSSTNRGGDRNAADYYVTPQEPIREFLREWRYDVQKSSRFLDRPADLKWFDPCAGGDAGTPMAYPYALFETFRTSCSTLDVREDSPAFHKGDYLKFEHPDGKPDVIITNPPFFLAQEIIEKALIDVADDGHVVMLLRLNWFGSEKRRAFFEKNMPVRCYVHRKRMSFTPDGKTDSIEYMHAVWKKGYNPEETKLRII